MLHSVLCPGQGRDWKLPLSLQRCPWPGLLRRGLEGPGQIYVLCAAIWVLLCGSRNLACVGRATLLVWVAPPTMPHFSGEVLGAKGHSEPSEVALKEVLCRSQSELRQAGSTNCVTVSLSAVAHCWHAHTHKMIQIMQCRGRFRGAGAPCVGARRAAPTAEGAALHRLQGWMVIAVGFFYP